MAVNCDNTNVAHKDLCTSCTALQTYDGPTPNDVASEEFFCNECKTETPNGKMIIEFNAG